MRDDEGEVHVAIVCNNCYEDGDDAHVVDEATQIVTGYQGSVELQIPESAQYEAEIYFCFVIGYRNSGEEWDTTKAGPIYVDSM